MNWKLWLIVGIALIAFLDEVESKKDKTEKDKEKEAKNAAKTAAKVAKEKEKEQKKLEKEKEKEQKKLEKEKEKKQKYLKGYLAESDDLPLVLACDRKSKYVRAGKITLNGNAISDQLQSTAEKECNAQMEAAHTFTSKGGPECRIYFASSNFTMKEGDVLRAVYQCSKSKPEDSGSWVDEAEKLEIAKQKKPGKNVVLKCKKDKAMIQTTSVKINSELANVTSFPELGARAILRECHGQTVKKMQAGTHVKGSFKCEIMNKSGYGGTLEIIYFCKGATHMGQEK